MTPESFAGHPRTIGELRAEKTGKASQWSPRDALIDLLRDIDAGKVVPEAMVLGFHFTDADGDTCFGFRQAGGPNIYVSLGLAQRLITRLQEG